MMANIKGNKHTKETKQKISKALKGRTLPKMSDLTKQKLRKKALIRAKTNPQLKGKDNPRYNQITFNCEYCGKETTKHPSNYNKNKHHFCSRECTDKWHIGMNHPNKKSDYIKFNCTQCGKLSKQKRNTFNLRNEHHFCSKKCFNNYISDIFKGNKSYNWQGGITELRKQIRGCRDYKYWRTAVFERDKYTCVVCGQQGGYLECHHIEEFAKIIKHFNIKTIEEAYNIPFLWDINNGITLCKSCHYKIHGRNLK